MMRIPFSISLLLLSWLFMASPQLRGVEYLFPNVVSDETATLPENTRLPFDWPAAVLRPEGKGSRVVLEWVGEREVVSDVYLRMTTALPLAEPTKVLVRLAESGLPVAVFDIRVTEPLYIHQVRLSGLVARTAMQQGLALEMAEGRGDWWFFVYDADNNMPYHFAPYFLLPGESDPEREFYKLMATRGTMGRIDVMEGAIMDALPEFRSPHGDTYTNALPDRAGWIFGLENEEGGLRENFLGPYTRERPLTLGQSLPLVSLNRLGADAEQFPIRAEVKELWTEPEERMLPTQDATLSSAEVFSTFYPMAYYAKTIGDLEVETMALDRLRTASQALWRDGRLVSHTAVSLVEAATGEQVPVSSRAVGLYLLGMAKSLQQFPFRRDIDDLKENFRAVAAHAIEHRLENGLWPTYFGGSAETVDPAGSAAIAAALALGIDAQLLDADAVPSLEQTHASLRLFLAADGYLGRVPVMRADGTVDETGLEREGYSVIIPGAVGFYAQFLNALEKL